MGAMKNFLIDVANDMGIGDTMSLRARAEADRRIRQRCCVCGCHVDPKRDEHVYTFVVTYEGVPVRKTWCVDCEAHRREEVNEVLGRFECEDSIELHMTPASCVDAIYL